MITEQLSTSATANETCALDGRNAIITGANRGLGQAIATAFVKAGANVLLVARDGDLLRHAERELIPLRRRSRQVLHSMPADVSRPEDVAAVLERAKQVLPGVTILVNNAGIYGPMGRLEDVDWSSWIEAVQVNLFGTVLMCRSVVPEFRRQGYGKIINHLAAAPPDPCRGSAPTPPPKLQ
jgi:3-oxoacyl-[acyl-carrier protein] reductase